MESKLERLKQLRKQVNMQVKGLDNYPKNSTVMMFVNHSCLLDIFYLPMALPEDIVSAVSARLMYKKDIARQQVIDQYLNAIPIEAHGTSFYKNTCLQTATQVLEKGISMSIFPEGIYIPGKNKIYRGRTGGTRILFNALLNNPHITLIPVAIKYPNGLDNIDNYQNFQNNVSISLLEPIDYQNWFEIFMNTQNYETRNDCLHAVTDQAMASIAQELGQEYTKEYFQLDPKDMILPNGDLITDEECLNPLIQKEYSRILGNRAKVICKRFKK